MTYKQIEWTNCYKIKEVQTSQNSRMSKKDSSSNGFKPAGYEEADVGFDVRRKIYNSCVKEFCNFFFQTF